MVDYEMTPETEYAAYAESNGHTVERQHELDRQKDIRDLAALEAEWGPIRIGEDATKNQFLLDIRDLYKALVTMIAGWFNRQVQ